MSVVAIKICMSVAYRHTFLSLVSNMKRLVSFTMAQNLVGTAKACAKACGLNGPG